MDSTINFMQALKAYRLRNRKTLRDLARETGIFYETIRQILSGHKPRELTQYQIETSLPGLYKKDAVA